MDDLDQKTKTNKPSERILIRISDLIPQPPDSNQTRNLLNAKNAAGDKIPFKYRLAFDLIERGKTSKEFRASINSSSATLNERGVKQLNETADIMEALEVYRPGTIEEIRRKNQNPNKPEIVDLKQGEPSHGRGNLILEQNDKGELEIPKAKPGQEYYSKEDSDIGAKYFNEYVGDAVEKYETYSTPETNYQEPGFAIPSSVNQSTPLSPESSYESTQDTLKRGGEAVTNQAKKIVSNAADAAKTSGKKLIKQGLTTLGSSAALALASAAPYLAAAGAIIVGFFAWLATVIITIVIWMIGFIVFVIIILFIINSGAYMVPPGKDISSNLTPPISGGLVVPCPPDSAEITDTLASKIGSYAKRFLLPLGTGPRGNGNCVIPTMIIVHWSAGYDNKAGNDVTYNTLIQRGGGTGLACQVATDTDDVYLMQPFYENSVEYPWCANSWNIFSINNEMAGGCKDCPACNPPYKCNETATECPQSSDKNSSSGIYDIAFDGNPPHPCSPEVDRALQTTCVLMTQYHIPWCQIFGHYNVPDSGGKSDPGQAFLEEYFRPAIKNRCPNDPTNICSGGSIDPLCQAYVQEIPLAVKNNMEGKSWRQGCPVSRDDLNLLTISYWGFDNSIHNDGKMIVHKDDAQNIASIFRSMCSGKYPIAKIKLVDDYYDPSLGMASDALSMKDNNTSAFNCRCLTGETPPCDYTKTVHSFGKAVDVNPVQNPYVDGSTILPNPEGVPYVDRNQTVKGMIKQNDILVNAFQNIGWFWGGNWTSPIDYQHFSYNNY